MAQLLTRETPSHDLVLSTSELVGTLGKHQNTDINGKNEIGKGVGKWEENERTDFEQRNDAPWWQCSLFATRPKPKSTGNM